MTYKHCLECNAKFHYCTSCDYESALSDGFCCEKCRQKYHNYTAFLKFYKNLLSPHPEKIQRLLEFVLSELWEAWIYHKLGVKNEKTDNLE